MAGACDSGSRQKHLIRNRLIIRNIMAIEQRIVNNSHTEIYVNGGGNFITQSRPTNFHQFFTRKILTPTEDISDFREVTAAERADLEKADAAWTEPPRSFIDLFDKAAGGYGRYNPETGFFELNGIKDITYSQAMEIMLYYTRRKLSTFHHAFTYAGVRTLIPLTTPSESVSVHQGFANSSLEKLVFAGMVVVNDAWAAFSGCRFLRVIEGVIIAPYAKFDSTFNFCYALEEVRIQRLENSISFKDSSNLSLESISYMVANASTGTKAITITLHPTAYARVTDELFALAAEKNITIAST